MPINIKTTDGVEMEITYADQNRSPSATSGQYVNTQCVWIRPIGGEWMRTRHRSAMAVCGEIKHCSFEDLKVKIGVPDEITEASSS